MVVMNLSFERVFKNDDKKIGEVYKILRICGVHMFKEQKLKHWKKPYPVESIRKDCATKEVFLAKDKSTNSYVHTFQLEFTSQPRNTVENVEIATINKFATLPKLEGKGIGKLSINYIEDYCRSKGVTWITLDVYDKSEHAFKFYKNRGFAVSGSRQTKYFTVKLMEKKL